MRAQHLLPQRVKVVAVLAVATCAGSVLALQTRVNGELSERAGPALFTALISFSIGLVAIALLITATGRWPATRALRSGDRRLWWFGGGLCGAVFIATAAYAVPIIGVALLAVCQVAGQLVGSLVVDRAGIAPGGSRPITAPRLAGAGLAIVAVLLSRAGQQIDVRPLIVALVALAGLLSAVQQAANGHIRRHSDEVLVAVLVNFAVGTVALLILCAVQYSRGRLGGVTWPGWPLWLYAGGVLGVAFVTITTTAVRMLGVLRLTLALVTGQLVGSVLLDIFWRTASRPTAQLYAAIVIVLVAAVVAGRPARRAIS